jgi:hypothetical protein
MAPPRDKFFTSIDPQAFQNVERIYLNTAIWPGTKDPTADVIQIQITGLKNGNWEEIGRLALYRNQQGYSELPPRAASEKQGDTGIPSKEDTEIPSKEDVFEEISKESEENPFA